MCIVDDYTIVRDGLRQILAETSDIVMAAEAQNGHKAISKVREDGYDVVVLDVAMPGQDGLSVMNVLKAELSLSVETVSTYRARILDKLRLSNNAEIIRYAISRSLVH